MQKDLKVQDFHSRREEEQSSDGGNPISLEEVGAVADLGEFRLANPLSERLHVER